MPLGKIPVVSMARLGMDNDRQNKILNIKFIPTSIDKLLHPKALAKRVPRGR
jgi:hypothetical protein